jgi:hypothetical protein
VKRAWQGSSEPNRVARANAERETEIMDVLWKQGPSTVAEVRKQVPDRLAYTTVLTILRNLEAKGYVGHDEEGPGTSLFGARGAGRGPAQCAKRFSVEVLQRLYRIADDSFGI